jgi:hypothetical protein
VPFINHIAAVCNASPPDEVVLPSPLEVGDARDHPVRVGHDDSAGDLLVPLHHIAVSPVAVAPDQVAPASSSRSATCVTDQFVGHDRAARDQVAPLINQIAVAPVGLLRHTRSLFPSPSKSPMWVTDQFVRHDDSTRDHRRGSSAPYRSLARDALRHTMSLLLSR